jgi:excisionase family DNA binding protein
MPSPNSLPAPLLVDIRGASKLLGLSTKTVGTWAVQSKIPSVKLGARRLFPVRALEEFVAAELVAQRSVPGLS